MKKDLMVNALRSVHALMIKHENAGVKIDTTEPEYKAVRQEVLAALEAPDEVETVPINVEPDWAVVIAGLRSEIATQGATVGDSVADILREVKKLQEAQAQPTPV